MYERYLDAVLPPASRHYNASGRWHLVASIAEELLSRGALRVLDCAAGTGFPALDLALTMPGNYEIHCCDGDPAMVEKLAERASQRFMPLSRVTPSRPRHPGGNDALVVDWIDLGQIAGHYDYVLCRGNALAYADTWTGGGDVATTLRIADYLAMMVHKVRPGGYLHVDAPWDAELPVVSHRLAAPGLRAIWEHVDIVEDRRKWMVSVEPQTKGEPWLTFTRYSSLLTIHDVAIALKELRLDDTTPFQLKHERANYGTIIARKPG
ncbi:MAG: class I SAM-dependent methyltransferase [Actinomycetota bacterium]